MLALLIATIISVPVVTDVSPVVKKYNEPVIITVNKIDESAANRFVSQVAEAQKTGQLVIPVIVDSYGGSVYALLKMIDVVEASPIPVAMICTGKAMSAGAVLFASGTRGYRYAGPNATIMIHEVSSMVSGKVWDIKTDASEAERLNAILFRILAMRSGKPENYYLDIIHKIGHTDLYLSAHDAMRHGLTDHVKVPRLVFNIKQEMYFD